MVVPVGPVGIHEVAACHGNDGTAFDVWLVIYATWVMGLMLSKIPADQQNQKIKMTSSSLSVCAGISYCISVYSNQ